jgi:hypothetical protein
LPSQQLAFVPIQLRFEPAFACPFDDPQCIAQQGQTLFDLPCDLTCRGQEVDYNGPYSSAPLAQ